MGQRGSVGEGQGRWKSSVRTASRGEMRTGALQGTRRGEEGKGKGKERGNGRSQSVTGRMGVVLWPNTGRVSVRQVEAAASVHAGTLLQQPAVSRVQQSAMLTNVAPNARALPASPVDTCGRVPSQVATFLRSELYDPEMVTYSTAPVVRHPSLTPGPLMPPRRASGGGTGSPGGGGGGGGATAGLTAAESRLLEAVWGLYEDGVLPEALEGLTVDQVGGGL